MALQYGSWALIAGGSDGVGEAFAHGIAARGLNVVLVARRIPVLEECAAKIRSRYDVEVRTVPLDLAAPDAMARLADATEGLEIGLLVYNAGGEDRNELFLDKDLGTHLALIQRNCASVREAAYRFGEPMVARGRGAMCWSPAGRPGPAARG
jgi:short-subunit dehydrogenase